MIAGHRCNSERPALQASTFHEISIRKPPGGKRAARFFKEKNRAAPPAKNKRRKIVFIWFFE